MGSEHKELSDEQFEFLKKFYKKLDTEYNELKDIEFNDNTLVELNGARLFIKMILIRTEYIDGAKVNEIIEKYRYLL